MFITDHNTAYDIAEDSLHCLQYLKHASGMLQNVLGHTLLHFVDMKVLICLCLKLFRRPKASLQKKIPTSD